MIFLYIYAKISRIYNILQETSIFLYVYAKNIKNLSFRNSLILYQLSVFAFAKTDAFRRLSYIRRLGYCEKKIAGARPKMTGAQRQLDFFSLFWADAQRREGGGVRFKNILFVVAAEAACL